MPLCGSWPVFSDNDRQTARSKSGLSTRIDAAARPLLCGSNMKWNRPDPTETL